MTELIDLMKHIDYLFENFTSTYDENKIFEIAVKEDMWTIIDKTDGKIFATTNADDALIYLTKKQIDLEKLHNVLYGYICTEGVLRRSQLAAVEKLVGIEEIDKSEEGWNKFTSALVKTIEENIGETEDKPKLGLVH